MREQALQLPLPGFERAEAAWRRDYGARMGDAINPRNRSGIEVKPLYSAADWSAERYMADLGFPGQPPMTRGIYPSMHRGRSWSQRQLIGFGSLRDQPDPLQLGLPRLRRRSGRSAAARHLWRHHQHRR